MYTSEFGINNQIAIKKIQLNFGYFRLITRL